MGEVRYMISEATKRVDVESHVLRYWEEELELSIGRNEMGHRYYTEADIDLLKTVKHYKEQGFQLKAIKLLLPNIHKLDAMDSKSVIKLENELNGKELTMWTEETVQNDNDGTSIVTGKEKHEVKDSASDKMVQFKALMNQLIMSALKENNSLLSEEISMNVTDGVIKEMNYLMRLQEEKEEERYKKFDATLRDYQKTRMQVAASIEGKHRKKSKFFKKNKIYI